MLAGRLADRGWTERATVIFPVLVAGSWLLLWFGRHQVGWLIAGIVVLDIGVQGIQVTNQTVLYRGSGHDRSRANAAYMVCDYAGGATGSAVAALLYSTGRWAAVCVFGATVGALGVIGAVADRLSPVRAAESPPPPSSLAVEGSRQARRLVIRSLGPSGGRAAGLSARFWFLGALSGPARARFYTPEMDSAPRNADRAARRGGWAPEATRPRLGRGHSMVAVSQIPGPSRRFVAPGWIGCGICGRSRGLDWPGVVAGGRDASRSSERAAAQSRRGGTAPPGPTAPNGTHDRRRLRRLSSA